MAYQISLPPLLAERDVCENTTLGRSSLWEMVRAGEFPAPVRIAARRVAWRAQDVVAWIESRETAQ